MLKNLTGIDKKSERGYNRKAMERIYLDYAATTPLDKEILEKMLPYLAENFGNPNSLHETGRKAMSAVDSARDALAELLNAKPSELYFTSGGTEADNWAILGGAYAQKELGKTHIVVSSIEHHAVLSAAARLEKEGFSVSYLPVDMCGRVRPEALKALLTEKTGLVAVMLANNETGAVQDIKTLAALAHENGSIFFTDAVQAAPYMPLDVKDLGVDMLSLSAHKFYGPKGVGALYIKSGVKVWAHALGGEQERGLRGGTLNVPAIVGLSAAYQKNAATMSATNEKIASLKALFVKEISTLGGVYIQDCEEEVPAILSVRFQGLFNVDILFNLDLRGVSAAAGSACASSSIEPSHVLLAMGMTKEEARESVRFSFGRYTTEEEVRRAAAILKEVVERLRKGL